MLKELLNILERCALDSKLLFCIHRLDRVESIKNLAKIKSQKRAAQDVSLVVSDIQESLLPDGTSRITINLKIA
jgi:hypothetical protein